MVQMMIPQLDARLMHFGKKTQTQTQIESDQEKSDSLIEDSDGLTFLIGDLDSLIFAKNLI